MTTKAADNEMRAYFRHRFGPWLLNRPEGTIGQLREWMEDVQDQCSDLVWEGDPPIEETEDIPDELAEYLSFWDEHDGEGFSYREPEIEEDTEELDEYIEELGRDTKLASFPIWAAA